MNARQAVMLIVGRRVKCAALGMSIVVASGSAVGQTPTQVAFAPGGQELFAVDLSRAPVGGFRSTIELPQGTVTRLSGNMGVVIKNGRPMLRATEKSELLIKLAGDQGLPQNFTIEVDFIPRDGGPEPDLRLEGMPSINQGDGSAHLEVMTDANFGTIYIVGGESTISEFPIPDDVRATLPETLTRVGVSVEGSTIRFFINGREMLPDPEQPAKTVQARFARGSFLRVTLGGLTDGDVTKPVYLARVRIATGAPTMVTAIAPIPGGTITPMAAPAPAPAPALGLAPRTIALNGVTANGRSSVMTARTIQLPAVVAKGVSGGLSPRIITLSQTRASGATTAPAGGLTVPGPKTIALPALLASGGSAGISTRSIALPGITASGGVGGPRPRIIQLPSVTASGIIKTP